MSLYAKTSSFEVYKFDNNFKLDGIINVLQERKTKDIFGTSELEYTSFEGHCSDLPSHLFHTDKILAFNVNIQEKVFNKQVYKKKFKEAHIEYNELKRLSASERKELELLVKTEMAPAALVKSKRTSFMIDLEKKLLFVGITSRHLNALSFLETFLGLKRLRQRSLFSEYVLQKAHSELASEMFFKWFYMLATGKIENNSPLLVRIDGEVKLRNNNDSLSFRGDNVCKYLEENSDENSKIKQLRLNICKNEDALSQQYFFRLSSKAGRIGDFSDTHFKLSKDEMASISYIIDKNRSFSEFLNNFDTLVYYFEEWFKKQDLNTNE